MLYAAFACSAWAYDGYVSSGGSNPNGRIYYNIVNYGSYHYATIVNPGSGGLDAYKPTGDITIPNTISHGGDTYDVTNIGGYAFSGYSGLTSVTIPNTVTLIGLEAFRNCTGLTTVVLPNGLTFIGESAFRDCSALTSISIPNTVTSVGKMAFYGCTSLTSLTIGSGLTVIDEETFRNCSALVSVTIPGNVSTIGYYSFSGCSNLSSATIGNGVDSIVAYAFNACGLTAISLPSSVVSIDASAFSRCNDLAMMAVANNNPMFDSRDSCNAIIETATNTLVAGCNTSTIPSSVSSVGEAAFYYRTGLTSISIPEGVTSLQDGAFGYTGLTSVTIPASVASIGMMTFYNCSSLSEIHALGQVAPTVGNNAFYHVYATVYIPCGSRPSYAARWTSFSNFVSEGDFPYTVIAVSNDTTMGTVQIAGTPTCDSPQVILSATANEGFLFLYWSDGDTASQRTITVTQDTVQTAYFAEWSCDLLSVPLPYTANFTQCWTPSGGATVMPNGSVRLNGPGQKVTSPSIVIPDSVATNPYFFYYISRPNPDGSDQYAELDDTVSFRWLVNSQVHRSFSFSDTYLSFNDILFQQSYAGQTIQLELEYTGNDTLPIYLEAVDMYQYDILLNINGPSYANVGDTVTFSAQVQMPGGQQPDVLSWYDQDWNYLGDSNSIQKYWNTPGNYAVYVQVFKYGLYNGHYASADRWFYITVLDTTPVPPTDCDSISLPYTADFTQCWTAEGGASIIDSNHASITSAGQKITSPWMQSVAGNTYLALTQQREGDCNYETEQFVITIEDESGVVQSWTESAGNWGSSAYSFTSPGGLIRVSFEYIGSNFVPSFQISDVALYNYQIETSIEGPVIARVGDTVTFASHAILQNNEMPDSYNWYMYKYTPNGISWVDENDPSRIIVSRTDSTLVVVWNTPGRFSVTFSVSKWDVYQSHHASASDWQYINIVARNTYMEDSIYYTSQAKDTVIGCHPQLHNANLPESVRVINDSAFFNLANLSTVSLPDGLEHIGKMAFAWNQGITEITLPRGLRFVGDNAFWWDTNLAVINFNADNCQVMSPSTASDGNYWPVFIGCDNVTTINIGENVTSIPDRAFSYCSKLRGTLVIPDNVTYIGNDAFYSWVENSPTLTVVLGRSVSEIGNFAFPGYYGRVNHVISLNPIPPTLQEASFYTMPDSSRATVPCGSTEAYRNGAYWNEFIIEEDCTGIGDEPSADVFTVTVIDGRIVIEGVCEKTVSVFDIMGRHVVTKAAEGNVVSISALPTGVYMVKIGILPAHKVVVIR